MGGLSIQLRSVKETPSRFVQACDPDWWDRTREALCELEAELHRGFELDLSGYRMGARLLFRGEFSGAVELLCGRCLDPYVCEFREPVQLLLEPAVASSELAEGQIALDPDDPEVGRYAGEELDFEPVLLDVLALAWPMQPRCGEECLGLCPVCGANRNREACGCQSRDASHPFASLGRLLERPERGGE